MTPLQRAQRKRIRELCDRMREQMAMKPVNWPALERRDVEAPRS